MLEHKELLSKLKWLVENKRKWDNFDYYLDYLIEQTQRSLEQADDPVVLHRNQGTISAFRKLKKLREQINSLDKGQ